ncbi:MAG: ABC transporter permease [Candidatus Edwardsbacteria bacterium]|jgi:putative ABC transport system permease protein|nr:ABC transporter permease [Candidatus Edwardsbacteria bacterium]
MMIGIVVGIAALTMVVSAGLGSQKRVMDRVKVFGVSAIMIHAGGGEVTQPSGGTPTNTLTVDDVDAIAHEVPDVVGVAPMGQKGRVEIKYLDRTATTNIFGVTPSWVPVWDWDVTEGDFITDEDMEGLNRVCVLGTTVYKALFDSTADPVGERIMIGSVAFEVKGLMKSKGTSPRGGDMDNRIFVPLSTFMKRVDNVDYISGVRVRFGGSGSIEQKAEEVRTVLRSRHQLATGQPDDFSLITPTEIVKVAKKVAGTFNVLLIIVSAISLIAGGVVIANLMLLSVNERRREIGLRMAVGASSSDIRQQFLAEAVVITLIGGVFGLLLGALGIGLMRQLSKMPLVISWASVLMGLVFSGAVGIVAGYQPAKRAARVQPVEALRG